MTRMRKSTRSPAITKSNEGKNEAVEISPLKKELSDLAKLHSESKRIQIIIIFVLGFLVILTAMMIQLNYNLREELKEYRSEYKNHHQL